MKKEIAQQHADTNDKQRDNLAFVLGEGDAATWRGGGVITGRWAGGVLRNCFWILPFFSFAAIFSAVAATGIKGRAGGVLGRLGEGGRRGVLDINGVIVGRSGAASPLTGVWGAADFSSSFLASDRRPYRFFLKESFSPWGFGGGRCCFYSLVLPSKFWPQLSVVIKSHIVVVESCTRQRKTPQI